MRKFLDQHPFAGLFATLAAMMIAFILIIHYVRSAGGEFVGLVLIAFAAAGLMVKLHPPRRSGFGPLPSGWPVLSRCPACSMRPRSSRTSGCFGPLP